MHIKRNTHIKTRTYPLLYRKWMPLGHLWITRMRDWYLHGVRQLGESSQKALFCSSWIQEVSRPLGVWILIFKTHHIQEHLVIFSFLSINPQETAKPTMNRSPKQSLFIGKSLMHCGSFLCATNIHYCPKTIKNHINKPVQWCALVDMFLHYDEHVHCCLLCKST